MTDPNRLVIGFANDQFSAGISDAIEAAGLVPDMYTDAQAAIVAVHSEVAPLAVVATLGCEPHYVHIPKKAGGLLITSAATLLEIPTALVGYPVSLTGLRHAVGGSLSISHGVGNIYLGNYAPMADPRPDELIRKRLVEWLGQLTKVAA